MSQDFSKTHTLHQSGVALRLHRSPKKACHRVERGGKAKRRRRFWLSRRIWDNHTRRFELEDFAEF
jgi:hypothetical protein